MRPRPLQTRWYVLPLSVFAIVLCVSLPAWQHVAAEKQPAAAAEKQNAGEENLTEKVDVTLPPMLRWSGHNVYHAEATLTNTSNEALPGPVLLVVQSTDVDGLTVKNADGKLGNDEPYFEIVPDGEELAPEKKAKPRKIVFAAAERLTLQDRRRFKLDYRVIRRDVHGNAHSSTKDGEKAKPADADAIQRVMQIQDRWTDRLMRLEKVVGTATGLDSQGQPVVTVFAEHANVAGIPKTVDGVPVKVVVTGRLFARQLPVVEPPPSRRSRPSKRVKPTDDFDWPVPIGVSTGNAEKCSSGTIACRVRDEKGKLYALSNNHVYALQNTASLGDDILQPGLADTGCRAGPDNVIGHLSAFVEIKVGSGENRVDAAVAEIEENALGTATPEDGYGTPSSQIVSPTFRQRVQKYGRTSELTQGTVIGVHATLNIGYSAGTARFVDQIVVMGIRAGFIKAGDSGSLLVTREGNNPVGLLFAGSLGGRYAIANRIDDVLRELKVTIDDGTGNNAQPPAQKKHR